MSELSPHAHVPDLMAFGDCRVCGHVAESQVHAPARNIEEELRVARAALNKLENHHLERMHLALKDQRELVARLEQERMEMRASNVQG